MFDTDTNQDTIVMGANVCQNKYKNVMIERSHHIYHYVYSAKKETLLLHYCVIHVHYDVMLRQNYLYRNKVWPFLKTMMRVFVCEIDF